MDNPLHYIGSQLSQHPELGKLSRRGFLLGSAALASCRAAAPLTQSTEIVKPSSQAYRPPVTNNGSSSVVSRPSAPVPQNQTGQHSSNFSKDSGVTFSRVLVSGNYIAMTFDDGPHPQNTPRLLDMMAARNIKATFYVIGRSVDTHPDVLRRTVAEGHEIGNHSYTHPLLSKLSDSQVLQEMRRCHEAVGRAAGVSMRTMRPPYGGLLQAQRELVHREFGYPTIMWAVDPLDWKRPGPSVVASRINSATTSGAIVLAHDLHSQTVDAMPATFDGLLRKGFQFVTVSQLIAMKQTAATPAS
jgi:peptidoglycan-N-acetylglucosamine deacetylase